MELRKYAFTKNKLNKKCNIFIILLSFYIQNTTDLFAQNKINVGIAPIGLLGKLAISTEFENKRAVSFGTTTSFNYFTIWKGVKAEVNARLYFANKSDSLTSEGIYAIIQPGIASFRTPYSVNPKLSLQALIDNPVYLQNERTFAKGIGIGFGYKKRLNNWFMDINCRFQSWSTSSRPQLTKNFNGKNHVYTPYNGTDRASFRMMGPGAIFAPTLIIGFQIN